MTMRIALIDNGSRLREQLEALLAPHDVTELSYPEAGQALEPGFDAVILSGSSLPQIVPVIANPDEVREEMRLIQECPVPLLGICYGAELAAFALGATLEELPGLASGMRTVRVTGNDALLAGLPSAFEAYEAHRWALRSLPEDFVELARSDDGIEIFRHASRALYGFQFHPEKMASEPALQVFRNFLALAGK